MALRQIDYGSDVICTDDLNPNLIEVDGTTSVAQALQRRLTTPRGRLYRHPDYGYDLRHQIGIEANLDQIRRSVELECLKEERVQEVSAVVTLIDSTELEIETQRPFGTMVVNVNANSSSGPFSLVLGVDELTVEQLELD